MLPDPIVEFFCTESNQISQITDESVGKLFVVNFVKDVAALVVPQGPAQFFVVHGGFALLLAPKFGNSFWFTHDEFSVETGVTQ